VTFSLTTFYVFLIFVFFSLFRIFEGQGTITFCNGYEITAANFVNNVAEGNGVVESFSGTKITNKKRRPRRRRWKKMKNEHKDDQKRWKEIDKKVAIKKSSDDYHDKDDDNENTIGGYLYTGSMYQGLRHGFGKIQFDDNTVFEGEFWLGSPVSKPWPEETKSNQDPVGGGVLLHCDSHERMVEVVNKKFCYLLRGSDWNQRNIASIMTTMNETRKTLL